MDSTEIGGGERSFPSTSWSMVRAATDRSSPEWKDRLERLVRTYWKPVYHSIRARWRKSNEDAKDLTQGFFALLLEGNYLEGLAPEHGTLRGYLKAALGHFLVDEERKREALKRGGSFERVPLDISALEASLADPGGEEDPFDREWVSSCFKQAVQELQRTLEAEGRGAHFQAFKLYYLDPENRSCDGAFDPQEKKDEAPTYASVASSLGLELYDVSNSLVYARGKLRTILKGIISDYAASEIDALEELRFVLGE